MKNNSKITYGLVLILLVVTSLSLFSCSSTTPAPTVAPVYFPQNIGSNWLFSIKDHTRRLRDSALVSIVGTTTVEGQTAYVWKTHYFEKGYNDTSYVVSQGNTVVMYVDTSSNKSQPAYVEYDRLTYPMTAGQIVVANGDSTSIILQGNYNTPAGSFANTSEIVHNCSNLGYHVYDKIWVSPYYGIVGIYHGADVYDNYMVNGTWELLDYNIKY